jgi:hypothetical protein
VYIASATRAHSGREENSSKQESGKGENEA